VNDQGQLLIGNSTSLVGPFAFSRGLQVTNQGAQLNAFTNNEFGEGIAFVKTRGTPSSPHTIVQLNDALGSVSFSGSDGSGYVVGSQIASLVDQVPGANDMPTCLTFSTTPDGSATCTERMRITSAGNVGIGTATPSGQLTVQGAGQATPSFDTAGALRGALVLNDTGQSQNNGGALLFAAASGAWRFAAIKGLATNGGDNSQGDIAFLVRPTATDATLTEKMRITNAGDVGIGTATPSSKLHVAGDLTVSSATVATSATAGANGDVPAQVAGYLVVSINGTARKIPYYA
jgi:hypothetical protein